jgi:hypothetical protein
MGHSLSDVSGPNAGLDAHLDSTAAWRLLAAFHELMGWHGTRLVDTEAMHDSIITISKHLSGLSASNAASVLATHGFALDYVALLYAALSLGALSTGATNLSAVWHDISIATSSYFVGPPTLDLCLSCFLQHMYALRTGTSNLARGFMVQAISHAHDLSLQQNFHGIRGLQLYLLLYMADQ